MDLKQLSYFTAIVDEGSISAAAKKLHISQPPLSHQMKSLECELGVILFDRGLRSITLTDAGKLLYTRAKTILDMTSATKMEINNLGSGLSGTLRIGMVSSSSIGYIARKLRDFQEIYPEVTYQIYEGNTYQMMDALKTSQIDLAFVRAPFSEDGFICHKYAEEYFVAAGQEGVLKDEDGLADLTHKPLILYRRWEPFIREVFQKKGLAFKTACIADNAWTCIQMAKTGMGIAIVPESFAVEDGEIKVCQIGEEALKSQLMLVKRADRYISNITRIFFEKFTM
ncbi:MAG: LysR family transcriptional regulator [Frisingicoccus sp.]|uniref:LysR family transcriptional regulator n=1 Tax=Frisingicoccus sp. TaxID=1918627 RepID=UPI0025C15208|nr:LysR family transcriptional regulator [Frisingicoccus sp.]MDY5956479.1 LysR family transcriptional regulator [Frisingicoccus sp.]